MVRRSCSRQWSTGKRCLSATTGNGGAIPAVFLYLSGGAWRPRSPDVKTTLLVGIPGLRRRLGIFAPRVGVAAGAKSTRYPGFGEAWVNLAAPVRSGRSEH